MRSRAVLPCWPDAVACATGKPQVDAAPQRSGPYLHCAYLPEWSVAIAAHRKSMDDHIKIIGAGPCCLPPCPTFSCGRPCWSDVLCVELTATLPAVRPR